MLWSQAAGSPRKCAKCGNSLQAFQAPQSRKLRRDFKTLKRNSTFPQLRLSIPNMNPAALSHYMNVGLLGLFQRVATIFLRLKGEKKCTHTHIQFGIHILFPFALKKSISQSGVTICGLHTPWGIAAHFIAAKVLLPNVLSDPGSKMGLLCSQVFDEVLLTGSYKDLP